MVSLESEAWILRVLDLGEADRVVDLLTRDEGRKRAVARGARRRFSRYRGVLQPLSKVWISAWEREGWEFARLRSVEPRLVPKRLLDNLEGVLGAIYLADLVATFAPENEPARPLFRLLDATVPLLEELQDRDRILRYAEIWVLRLTGIFPPALRCPDCGDPLEVANFDPSDGALRCRSCSREERTGLAVDKRTMEVVEKILEVSPSDFCQLSLSPEELERVAELARAVRRSFLQQELPSYLVFERTLATLPSLEVKL